MEAAAAVAYSWESGTVSSWSMAQAELPVAASMASATGLLLEVSAEWVP